MKEGECEEGREDKRWEGDTVKTVKTTLSLKIQTKLMKIIAEHSHRWWVWSFLGGPYSCS